MITVKYFFDPMCGWCYGATQLIETLAEAPEFNLEFHAGGMLPRQPIAPEFRSHILQADKQIEAKTQMPFGEPYKARMAGSEAVVLDSYITTKAFLVGQKMGIQPHIMLKTIQAAHYQQGESVEHEATLKAIAINLGLAGDEWDQHMAQSTPALMDELDISHSLMQQHHVSGYPILVAQIGERYKVLPISHYYGDQTGWKKLLYSLL